MGDDLPLIVTADLDPGAMAFLDGLRRAHFPPERNHLRAHLTLFHHLPGEEAGRVRADLADVAATEPLEATIDRVLKLGRGVAYGVHSPGLVALRAELARRWEPWLTPQDRSWGRPHVTVQNKVTPDAAAALHARLAAAHAPRPARVEALCLWRYLGGPWEPSARWRLGD
jgi:hypothetical protein